MRAVDINRKSLKLENTHIFTYTYCQSGILKGHSDMLCAGSAETAITDFCFDIEENSFATRLKKSCKDMFIRHCYLYV